MEKIRTCATCSAPIVRTSSKQNNVKYCATCRIEAMKYTEYRRLWQQKRAEVLATGEQKGKLPCLICGKFYRKPMTHVRLRHESTAREYKTEYGLNKKRGIITEDMREVLRDHVAKHADVVIKKNLVEGGKNTRYKPALGKIAGQ